MNRLCMTGACCGAFVLAFSIDPAAAGFVTVDGDLSDWNVQVADGNGSDWSNAGTFQSGGKSYFVALDDQDDAAGFGGYVGPLYGGQDYDAEFLGVGRDAGRLVLAIATGQRPDNGFAFFSPGDLLIETSIGVFGLEIGGSHGANGSTYNLQSNGTTATVAANSRGVGTLWLNPEWIAGLPQSGIDRVQMGDGGTLVGSAAEFIYRHDAFSQHSIIEAAIDLDLFGGATIESVQWSPSCGNDIVQIIDPIPTAPEPSTFALLSLGGLGLVGRAIRRRRRRTAD